MEKKEDIRFEFGKNWADYSNTITKNTIKAAEKSLCNWLQIKDMDNKKFLDIGSGSGLFSLAAWNMGAGEIYSFDYDAYSVDCTKKLKEFTEKEEGRIWNIEQGDVLDKAYMKKFYNKYDIVYSWGVLHHTGNMERALAEAGKCVCEKGYLFISIYNDQGIKSRIWKWVKREYNLADEKWKERILWLSSLYLYGYNGTKKLWSRKERSILGRGMNRWTDLVDWVGGYPFEYATAEKIITFYLNRGFKLVKLNARSKQELGCHQFVFERKAKGCMMDK